MSDPIRYVEGQIPTAEQLALLHAGEAPGAFATPDHRRALEQSQWVATAWHGDRLVGLARVLTDHVSTAYLQELLVHADYHHQGVGKELLDCYDRAFGDFAQQVTVVAEEWARQKLGKRGFKTEPAALSRSRALGL
jgi:GNAT superfamily N-acetyltransferase